MTNIKKDLLPTPSIHSEDGQALFSLDDLITYWKLSADEMRLLEENFLKSEGEADQLVGDKDDNFLLN